MARLIIRDLDDTTKEWLRRRAVLHGRSIAEEVREIIQAAVRAEEETQGPGLGTQIAALFGKGGLKKPIRELRGHILKPPSFNR
jgi:plasmid stability protein